MKKTMLVTALLVAGLLAVATPASAARNYVSGDIGMAEQCDRHLFHIELRFSDVF